MPMNKVYVREYLRVRLFPYASLRCRACSAAYAWRRPPRSISSSVYSSSYRLIAARKRSRACRRTYRIRAEPKTKQNKTKHTWLARTRMWRGLPLLVFAHLRELELEGRQLTLLLH